MSIQIWRFVPISFLVILAVGAVIRLRIHRRRFGSGALVLFRARGRERLLQVGALILPAVLMIESVGAAIHPSMIAAAPGSRVLGLALMIAGFLIFCVAQFEMGASWRIGIDPRAKPGLVTSGIFSMCRNPMYAGMIAWLSGFACLVPNWLSLANMLGFAIGISLQIREEEKYLAEKYRDDFYAYARRTGRLLPWIGRIRSDVIKRGLAA